MVDLRELLAKTCSGEDDGWERLRLVAPQRTARHAKALRQDMLDSGDLPPPLDQGEGRGEEEEAEAHKPKADGSRKRANATKARKRKPSASKASAPAAGAAAPEDLPLLDPARGMYSLGLTLVMCAAAIACAHGVTLAINRAGSDTGFGSAGGSAAPADVEPFFAD